MGGYCVWDSFEQAFIELMGALNLPYPKKIEASLPANLMCGAE